MSSLQDQTVGFKASDIVQHFNQLKSIKEDNWWKEYLVFEWNNVRSGKNNTKWISIKYRQKLSDNFSRLNVIIVGEIHTGQIMPNTLEDVAEIKARNPEAKVEQREMKPSLQFQKWSKQVQTQEDRVSLIIQPNGKPLLPGDEYLSKYFQVAAYVDEIFKKEIQERIERYTMLVVHLAQNKGIKDTPESMQELRKQIGHVNDGDTIVQDSDYKSLKEKFPKSIDELIKGFVKITNSKCSSIIQEYISDRALKNRGQRLPNPMTRVTIPFDSKGSAANLVNILDKNKPFKSSGRIGFERGLINGEPVNANTIHKFIVSKCVIDGVICLDSICCSQLGISIPIKITTMIVKQPVKRENNIFNVCNSIYGETIDNIEISESSTNNKVEQEVAKLPNDYNPSETEDDFINELTNS